MEKTIQQLQAELDREQEYTRKINERYERLREQLKESIAKEEHARIVANLHREYERKLSEINLQLSQIHNERGAGRKRIASDAIIARVLELSAQGLSQAKIAAKLSEELNIKIGRTTVGEIVRGKYTPPDAE